MLITEILAQSDFEAIRKELTRKNDNIKVSYDDIAKQYDPAKHDIKDQTKRPDKQVKKPTGTKDKDGNEVYQTVSQTVARLTISMQKIIVGRRAAFLIGDGIKLNSKAENPNQEGLFEMVRRVWTQNKLDYKTRTVARTLFKECEVAELWYLIEDMTFWQKVAAKLGLSQAKYAFRMKILANSLGDKLYPHFDEYGDMDAFSREYTITDGEKKITKFEIYTSDVIYRYSKTDSSWTIDEKYPMKNLIGKIPIIYYYQPEPEWYDVQDLIDRFEKSISNFAESNDYFGSPMVVLKGDVTGFADKGDQGKMIQLEGDGASADYLTWDQAPEAIKLEIETLQNLIYSLSQTPDISFSQLKSLGNTFSGVALKMMFLDAHLACMLKMETFGEMIQRRINLIKAAAGKVIAVKYESEVDALEIEPEFNFYLPSNESEMIDNLATATGNKQIISRKTAIKLNPLVSDPDGELSQIEAEEQEAAKNELTGSLNI